MMSGGVDGIRDGFPGTPCNVRSVLDKIRLIAMYLSDTTGAHALWSNESRN